MADSIDRRSLPLMCAAALATMTTAANSQSFAIAPKKPPPCDTPTECQFSSMGGTATLLAYTGPVFNREGQIVSIPKDPNIYTNQWQCFKCGKSWSEVY